MSAQNPFLLQREEVGNKTQMAKEWFAKGLKKKKKKSMAELRIDPVTHIQDPAVFKLSPLRNSP